jgi:hypothetical protein
MSSSWSQSWLDRWGNSWGSILSTIRVVNVLAQTRDAIASTTDRIINLSLLERKQNPQETERSINALKTQNIVATEASKRNFDLHYVDLIVESKTEVRNVNTTLGGREVVLEIQSNMVKPKKEERTLE